MDNGRVIWFTFDEVELLLLPPLDMLTSDGDDGSDFGWLVSCGNDNSVILLPDKWRLRSVSAKLPQSVSREVMWFLKMEMDFGLLAF